MWVDYLLDWRIYAILFLLFNLKSIPLSWHMRAFYHFISNYRALPYDGEDVFSKSFNDTADVRQVNILFEAAAVVTRTPLLETDFNWHKSNSTFFSDLDISRLKVMSRIYSPGMKMLGKKLAAEGHPGWTSFTLGSTYCSFRKPLRPYEPYRVVSRVLCWDRKWLYILSWFERLEQGKSKANPGEEPKIIAYAISKYVCKKGRFTVDPNRLLCASGLLPSDWAEYMRDLSSTRADDEGSGEESHEEQWYRLVERERVRGLDISRSFAGMDEDCFAEVSRALWPTSEDARGKHL
jgi:hypothetical protein